LPDMPAVFPEVQGNPVRPGIERQQRRAHRIGMKVAAGVPHRRDMVDVDAQTDVSHAWDPFPVLGWRAMRTAIFTAATRLPGSAIPLPAMSSAVPWSGDVRTNGSPSVTLTPPSTSSVLIGISAWSWYMQIAAS